MRLNQSQLQEAALARDRKLKAKAKLKAKVKPAPIPMAKDRQPKAGTLTAVQQVWVGPSTLVEIRLHLEVPIQIPVIAPTEMSRTAVLAALAEAGVLEVHLVQGQVPIQHKGILRSRSPRPSSKRTRPT